MKKLMLVTMVAALPLCEAYAANGLQTACDPGVTPAATIAVAANSFIVNPITPQCSKNVWVRFNQGTVGVAVGSTSVKGKNSFAGSSLGGQVAQSSGCQATPCAQSDADTAANTQNTNSL